MSLFKPADYRSQAISPMRELGAYEALWLQHGASFKSIACKFKKNPHSIPSDFIPLSDAMECGHLAVKKIKDSGTEKFGIRVHGAGEYPQKLRDAEYPVELLYYSGLWELVETPCISVVGTREPTNDGIERARRLVKNLVQDGITVVSGLARGIDKVAHSTALELGGRTIGVIGTPLNKTYPAENRELQNAIAKDHLIISQVPVLRYGQTDEQNPTSNRFFFPERNITMSALTYGTVIIEAGETSGTLYQAKAAVKQNRKLFILDNLFNRDDLTWPKKFLDQGAIRVKDYGDIRSHLNI